LRVFQNGRTARLGNERRAASARVQVVVGQMMETGVHYGSACAVAAILKGRPVTVLFPVAATRARRASPSGTEIAPS